MRELSMHILDLAQNSIAAGARHIDIRAIANTYAGQLTIAIGDDGNGMAPEMVERVKDPFCTTRTTRRVGLGIPMFEEAAKASGGSLIATSERGKGTLIIGMFGLHSIDRAPMGDIAATLVTLIAVNPDICFRYMQKVDDKEFVLDTDEVKDQLDGVPINENAVLKWLGEYIKEGTQRLSF